MTACERPGVVSPATGPHHHTDADHVGSQGTPAVDWLAINDLSPAKAAEAYARAGRKVHPLKPGTKEPATEHGYLDATDDVDQVRQWWAATPDANIGLPMGPNGLYAVDTDPRNGGVRIPPDVPTLTAETAGGGTHDVFDASALNGHGAVGKLADGIDVKYRGYIVAAPSVVGGRRYRWTSGVSPGRSPSMDARVSRNGASEAPTAATDVLMAGGGGLLDPIPMGSRDNGLRDRAWRLTGMGIGHADGIELLDEVIRRSEALGDGPAWNYADTDPETVWRSAADKRAQEADGDPEFIAALSPAVAAKARDIWRYEQARDAVNAHRAAERASGTLTVSEALEAVLNGDDEDVPTVALIVGHEHGWGLFYPETVNGIFGDQSVAKSVILAEIQARELADGGTVVHWEFDNNPTKRIIRRLLRAGAKREDIDARFRVLHSPADRDRLPDEVRDAVTLVTLDALNPAITNLGVRVNDPEGTDTVLHECFRPFTLRGACGVLLDHVGHGDKERQTGSIRKSQAVQGALYEAVRVDALKPGLTGRTRLILRKDNVGSLGMEGRTVAVARMISEAEVNGKPGPVSTTFEIPDPFNDDAAPVHDPRPDETNVQRIMREMDQHGLPVDLSVRAARAWLKARDLHVRAKNDAFNEAVRNRAERGPIPSPVLRNRGSGGSGGRSPGDPPEGIS